MHDISTSAPQPQAAPDIELQCVRDPDPQDARQVVSAEQPEPLSRKVVLKILSSGFSFFVAGSNDGSLGALVLYILRSYKVGTSFISIMSVAMRAQKHFCVPFFSPGLYLDPAYQEEHSYAASFLGWLLAAAANNYMLEYMDTGSILAIGAILQLISNLLRFWKPPFGLFATTFFISSLGAAFQDSHSNTFVSTVNGAHRCRSLNIPVVDYLNIILFQRPNTILIQHMLSPSSRVGLYSRNVCSRSSDCAFYCHPYRIVNAVKMEYFLCVSRCSWRFQYRRCPRGIS